MALKLQDILLYLGLLSWGFTIFIARFMKQWSFEMCSKLMYFNVLIGLSAAWFIWLSSPMLLLNITCLTWVSDSAAYLIGSKFGMR